MNKRDKAFLKRISEELKKDTEKFELPETLKPESIAQLLKENSKAPEINEKEVKKGIYVAWAPSKRVIAAAAAFVIIAAAAVFYIGLDRPPSEIQETAAETEAGLSGDIGSSSFDFKESDKIGNVPADTNLSSVSVTQENNEKEVKGVKKANSYSEIEESIWKARKKAQNSSKFSLKNFFGGLFSFKKVGDIVREDNWLDTPSGSESVGYGRTNEQVEGVAEADIIKNDGRYLYIATQYGVRIVDTANNTLKHTSFIRLGQITKEAFTSFEKSTTVADEYFTRPQNHRILEIFVQGNRLAAIFDYYRPMRVNDTIRQGKSVTGVTVFDISDRSSPKELLHYTQDGYYVSSRIYNGSLSLVTSYDVYYIEGEEEVTKKISIPVIEIQGKADRLTPESIYIPEKSDYQSYLVVGLIKSLEKNSKIDTKAVLGGADSIYQRNENLYTARSIYDGGVRTFEFRSDMVFTDADETEILYFTLKDGNIRLNSRNTVSGGLLNQFAMDEKDGYFRIATGDSRGNNLFVLDKNLNEVGKVTGFAKGERIKSVRFMGDTAYVVTFVLTDPLFVFDLHDPRNPKIVGELKIPGFSEYLHPVGDNLLIGIGLDGTDTGINGDAKISLFDVSDPTKPIEIDHITYPSARISSNHKAFLTIPEKNLYVVTVMQYRQTSAGQLSVLRSFSVENRRIVPKLTYSPAPGIDELRGTYIGSTLYAIDPMWGIWAMDIDSAEVLYSIDFFK